uniref:Uncharacterized protein n=1 Tax=Pararge aegeria TaxID=116150 RepID=S4PUZ0_9NEOP
MVSYSKVNHFELTHSSFFHNSHVLAVLIPGSGGEALWTLRELINHFALHHVQQNVGILLYEGHCWVTRVVCVSIVKMLPFTVCCPNSATENFLRF